MLQTELAQLYLQSAKDVFFEQMPSISPVNTKVHFELMESRTMSASCNAFDVDRASEIEIIVSTKCLENLSADLDLNDENLNVFFEWRLNWLAWHELAHWLYGHIDLYRNEGWIAQAGISEDHSGTMIHEPGMSSPQAPEQFHPLAHVAELEADSYATRRLYSLMAEIPVSDDDHGDTPEEDLQFCYYTIMTTICCFFANGRGSGEGKFHLSWGIRSLNVFVTLFGAYLERYGLKDIATPSQDVRELEVVAARFIHEAIQPTVEGVEDYARRVGCHTSVHGGENAGLFDPDCLIDVFTGASTNETANNFLSLLRHHEVLVSRTQKVREERRLNSSTARIFVQNK